MKTKIVFLLLCLSLLLMSFATGNAQTVTSGQLIGTVKDPTGAVIPGAKTTLTSAAGEKREIAADAAGNFRYPMLPPGLYTLTVEAPGFKPMSADNVTVRVTETTELTVNLQLAGATETVNITAEPPLVQATTPTAGRVIAESQVKQLPLPTRNFQQLLALSPGTVGPLSNNTELGRGDMSIDVNGQRTTSNNVVVDGTQVNSPGTNSTGNLSVPSPDAVQEFIVQTSLYDATQGRNAGGNVALVTKSGTNQVHGSLFEFFRNRVLNANDYFYKRTNPKAPILNRNQFGFTLGGPLVQDKTFFFFSYQGTRERNGAALTNSLTFPSIPAGLTNDRSDATLAALATTYGAASLSSISKAILQATLPNGQYAIPSSSGGIVTPLSGVSRFREDQFNVNIDQQITPANKLSGKFFFSNTPQFQALFSFVGSNPLQLPGYGGNIEFHNRVVSLADTHIISPNIINEARFGFSRIYGPSTPQEPFTAAQFGINNPLCATNPSFCGMPTIQVLGLFSLGSTYLADQKSVTNTFQASDMVSVTHGRHFIRTGAEVTQYRVDFAFNFFSRGQVNFNTFKDFLSGNIALGLLGNGVRDRGYRMRDGALFLQDDYRVTNSLTLNLGMRFGRSGAIREIRNRIVGFDPEAFATNTFPCTLAAPCMQGFYTPKRATPNVVNWAPRFGFAWKPLGKTNMALRGGFGVYFDRFSTRLANLQIFNYPYDIVGIGLGSFASPFPNLATVSFPVSPAQMPSPVPFYFAGFPLAGFSTPISGVYTDPKVRTPYVYQYSLGVQYEFKRDWLLETGYVGSAGRKLISVYTLNQGTTGTAPYNNNLGALGATSIFSNNKILNGMQMVETNANAHYNSWQTSVTKRFGHGLQFLASYTFSKSIDETSGAVGNELAGLPGDQQSLASNRAVSDFDRPHRLVFSGTYALPKLFRGGSGFAKRVANDWQLNSVITLQSGAPFSVICNSGSALYNRADLVAGQPLYTSGSVKDRLNGYFNTGAFAATCTNAAPYGTSGRNLLRGPNQHNVDIGLAKFIPVTERQKLEFRTEFFNAFNFVNFANPNANVMVPATLGKITATSAGPRVIQFALKYSF
jgi:hypothetical protein